jgi:predicted nucleic acid-binding protein
VDTGAWVAYISPDDQYHRRAYQWMLQNRQPLLTTDYVIDEALTLLKARGERVRAWQLGLLLLGDANGLVRLHYLTVSDILAAWDIFLAYTDKEWSFTDCTSRVVIERLGLAQAFAFDQHFRQFGNVAVVP